MQITCQLLVLWTPLLFVAIARGVCIMYDRLQVPKKAEIRRRGCIFDPNIEIGLEVFLDLGHRYRSEFSSKGLSTLPL